MTDESAAFAAWVLALVPRLVLWPGGVALLLAGGLAWWRRGTGSVPSSALARLGLALAWVAVALLPLPGAAPLSPPPDALVLTGLLLAAGALVAGDVRPGGGAALCAGVVAVCAAGAGSFLLPFAPFSPLVALLAAIAYAWGLASMADPASPAPPPVLRLLLALGWGGLAALLPPPWNLAAGAGALVLLLALAGWSPPARLAGQTAGIGWLALAGAVVALLVT